MPTVKRTSGNVPPSAGMNVSTLEATFYKMVKLITVPFMATLVTMRVIRTNVSDIVQSFASEVSFRYFQTFYHAIEMPTIASVVRMNIIETIEYEQTIGLTTNVSFKKTYAVAE